VRGGEMRGGGRERERARTRARARHLSKVGEFIENKHQ
jgi:hypothetical protein